MIRINAMADLSRLLGRTIRCHIFRVVIRLLHTWRTQNGPEKGKRGKGLARSGFGRYQGDVLQMLTSFHKSAI